MLYFYCIISQGDQSPSQPLRRGGLAYLLSLTGFNFVEYVQETILRMYVSVSLGHILRAWGNELRTFGIYIITLNAYGVEENDAK